MTKTIQTERGEIYIYTGEVIDLRETLHVTHSSTTTQHQYSSRTTHSTSSSTTLKLALKQADGSEKHVELDEKLQIGVRPGNKVSVMSYFPQGIDEGAYALAYNHDTGDKRTKRVLVIGKSAGCLAVATFFIGIFTLMFFVGFFVLGALAWWGMKRKNESDAIMAEIEQAFETIRTA